MTVNSSKQLTATAIDTESTFNLQQQLKVFASKNKGFKWIP